MQPGQSSDHIQAVTCLLDLGKDAHEAGIPLGSVGVRVCWRLQLRKTLWKEFSYQVQVPWASNSIWWGRQPLQGRQRFKTVCLRTEWGSQLPPSGTRRGDTSSKPAFPSSQVLPRTWRPSLSVWHRKWFLFPILPSFLMSSVIPGVGHWVRVTLWTAGWPWAIFTTQVTLCV